ncbi:hypothetical protein K0M31_017952 [Melipona bicolor]|uniref:Uncharacterized protein n=1 Tax=Melipona bicolor TaxID=60889 RepID=A0AA40G5U1_9HYME|nr:hypothetical protein K0M31_017952 [Melipona bicolor]
MARKSPTDNPDGARWLRGNRSVDSKIVKGSKREPAASPRETTSRAGPAAACSPLFSGYLRATFDIIREREEAVAKRRGGGRNKRRPLVLSSSRSRLLQETQKRQTPTGRRMKREMKRASWPALEEKEGGKGQRGRAVLLTSARYHNVLATIYNMVHRGKTASVRTSVTEGQPDTKRALCFECLAPD